MYAKDLSKPKYEYLITEREDVGIKHFNDPNAFIECSNKMVDAYKNIDHYNPSRKRRTLIVSDDMIAAIMCNKKLQAIIKESGVGNSVFYLFLLSGLIFLFQNMSD